MAANPYKGMTIDLNGDVTDFSKALRDAKNIAKGTSTELRELNNAMKVDPGNAKLLAAAQENYRKQIQASEKELEILKKKEQEILSDPEGKDSVSSEVWTKLQADIAKCEVKLKDTKKALKDLDFEPAIKAAREETKSTVKELERLEESLKLDPKSLDLLAQKQEILTRAIEASKKEAEALKKKEQELSEEDLSTAEWTNLRADIHDAQKAVEHYEEELREVVRVQSNVPRLFIHTGDDVKNAAGEVQQGAGWMEDAVKKAVDDIEEEFEELGDAAEESGKTVGEALRNAGSKVQDFGGTISGIGDAYTRSISVPIVGAAAASVNAAIDIDTALTDVKKTVDGTEEEYQALKQAAIDYSQVNAVSPSEILSIQALGAQLGFGKDQLKEFAEVASGLDIATNMNAEDAATEMAHFANIVGMNKDQISNYASTIVELGNNTATTEADISAMAQRIAGAGKSMGMSSAEILGMAAALSSLGIEAEAGGTAISTIMSSIDSSVAMGTKGIQGYADELGMSTDTMLKYLNQDKQAIEEFAQQSGMKTSEAKEHWNTFFKSFAAQHGMELDKFKAGVNDSITNLHAWSEAAGMSAEEFAKAWEEKPIEAFQAVTKGLQNGVAEGSNLSNMLSQLGIDAVRQADLMKRVAGSGDLMTNTINLANKGWEENKALSKEVENRNDSLASKFEILKNRVTAVADDVGGPLADALLDAIDAAEPLFKAVADGAKAFSSMSKEEQLSVIQTVGMVAAIGPLLSAVGRLTTGIGGAMKVLGKFGSAIGDFGSSGKTTKSVQKGLKIVTDDIGKVEKAAGGATKAAGGLAGAGGLGGLIAVAGLVVAAFAIEKWQEYQTEIKLTHDAVKDLSDLEAEAAGKTDYIDHVDELTQKAHDMKQAQVDANKVFVDTLRDAEIQAGTVQHYGSVIEELTKKGQLTRDEQLLLQDAIRKVNDATGDNIEAIDIENGKLNESIGLIKNNTQAWLDNLYIKIYQDEAAEALKRMIDAQLDLEDAQNTYAATSKEHEQVFQDLGKAIAEGNVPAIIELSRKYAELGVKTNDAQNDIYTFNEELKTNQKRYEDCTKKAQELQATHDEEQKQLHDLWDAVAHYGDDTIQKFNDMQLPVEDFCVKLQESGLGARDLGSVSKEQFDQMLSTFGTDVDGMIGWLKYYNQLKVDPKAMKLVADSSDVDKEFDATKKRIEARKIQVKMEAYMQPAKNTLYNPRNLGIGVNAAGGLFRNANILNSIPKHADGFIGDRPMLTSVGWAFEAGAEALIPLDNKQKVAPFAKAVASFMPSGGDTYLVIDGAVVNSNPQIKQAFLDLFEDVFRMGGMNRG